MSSKVKVLLSMRLPQESPTRKNWFTTAIADVSIALQYYLCRCDCYTKVIFCDLRTQAYDSSLVERNQMNAFSGRIKITDVLVHEKRVVGKTSIPVVELLFLGGKFECFQSIDLDVSVKVGDRYDTIEFEIQQVDSDSAVAHQLL